MDRPLDEYIIALSTWQHVEYIRMFFVGCMIIGVIGFFYFWLIAVKTWFSGMKDAWKNKRGLFWTKDLSNPFVQKFFGAMIKSFLVWLIPGWPLLLILLQLASAEAFNVLLGYDAISSPE